MKKMIAAVLFIIPLLGSAQKDYRVVFDLTGKDSGSQKLAVRWVTEVINADKDAKAEVVMYAQGIYLAMKDKSLYADEIAKLVTNKNVSFKVCAVAMKNQNVDASQLLPGIEIVPDGIYEIISKQREHWGYIKVAH